MIDKEELKVLMEGDMYATTININGYEYDFRFTYDFIRAEKGAWFAGVQVDPDIPNYVEIGRQEMFYDNDWRVVELPEESLTDYVNEIMEEMIG